MPGSTMSAASRSCRRPTTRRSKAFQLLLQARRHHPGARAGARHRQGARARAEEAEGPPDGGQSLRPRRQGPRHGRRASAGQGAMTTRIDRRFAALKEEGRAALVTFIMAGDPDYATSLAIAQSAAAGRRRRDRARHAVHRSDGGRSGDPGRRLARAQGRAEHEADARRWCASSAPATMRRRSC